MYAKIQYKIKTVNGWLSASVPVSIKDKDRINEVITTKLQSMYPQAEIKKFFIEGFSSDPY